MTSYDMHRRRFDARQDFERLETWKNKDTVDFWRHERMYSCLLPFIGNNPDARWLTVGDGRYGTDANYIVSSGAKNVLATDISETMLRKSCEDNFIPEYKIENAESLSFDSNSFDYVLCKESYHHFPRPMIALYEMLRVARKSVILIEPQDQYILDPGKMKIITLMKGAWKTFKKAMTGKAESHNENYEESGNYVYSISKREIEKVALGLNYEVVSFKELNDHYVDGVEFESKSSDGPLYKKVLEGISHKDKRTRLGLQPADILIAMIHKERPADCILSELTKAGFSHVWLSRNPYIRS